MSLVDYVAQSLSDALDRPVDTRAAMAVKLLSKSEDSASRSALESSGWTADEIDLACTTVKVLPPYTLQSYPQYPQNGEKIDSGDIGDTDPRSDSTAASHSGDIGDTDLKWEDPRPVRRPLPTFPDHTIGIVTDLAAAIAEALEQPIDYSWMTALAAVSGCTQGKATVQHSPGHREGLALYVMPAMPSGTRKTEAARIVNRPIRDWQRERWDAYRTSTTALELELAIDDLKRVRQGKANPDRAAAIAERQAAEMDVARLEAQQPTEVLAPDDITPEALGAFMARNGGAAFLSSSEGGFIQVLGGLYSAGQGTNLDLVLKAYDGEEVRIGRIGREAATIEHPHLALVIGAQPHVLHKLREDASMRERGFMSRFQVVQPESHLGYRTGSSRPVPDKIQEQWSSSIRALLDRFEAIDEPVMLTFDPDAALAFRKHWIVIERKMRPGELLSTPPGLQSWGSKLPGTLARIAALLTLAEDPQATTVPLEQWTIAEGLTEYLARHAHAAWLPRGLSPAEQLLADLRHKQPWMNRATDSGDIGDTPGAFTTRDLWQLIRGQTSWVQNVDSIREALDKLHEHGWIRPLSPPSGPGRKPEIWQAHPHLLQGDRP